MRLFLTLFLHELRMLAIAMPTYIAATVFLLLMGGIYWFALFHSAQGMLDDGTPVEVLFQLFFVPLLVVIPLITMRSFAEESRLGTLGALLSTPVKVSQVVLAKFFAAYTLYLLFWALALLFPLIAWWTLGDLYNDPRLLSPVALLGGAIFIAISSTFYIAVGIIFSSLTRSLLVAGLLTFGALALIIILGKLFAVVPFGDYQTLTAMTPLSEYLDTFKYQELFSRRGFIDTRAIFLFLTSTLFVLGLTTLTVESKS